LSPTDSRGRSSWLSLAAAILVLNASLSFHNFWPTPAFWWTGDLSIECAICLLALVVISWRRGTVPRGLLPAITATWVVLVFGRYEHVTALALLGRPINPYWDVRYASDVTAMFVRAAPVWGVVLTLLAIVALVAAVYVLVRWAFGRLARAMTAATERLAVGIIAAATIVFFVVQALGDIEVVPQVPVYSTPVIQTYARQAQMLRDAIVARSRPLAPSPRMNSDLSLVAGADVLLVFMESYGAITWQRPDFVTRLGPDRARLADDVQSAGKGVVSALVESPTFGGSSWYAHISLLSGIEVRDPNTNALLMTQQRETVVTEFARHGYRTLAVMPGLWSSWPEGAFYGFQDIYGGERLAYKGPQFGWWDIPDQFSLAQTDALEGSRRARAPLFIFLPTVSTHTPFTPTPPYQPDWARMLTDHPFDDADVMSAFRRQPDWMNLGPSYGNAVAYAYQVLGGYLQQRRERDFVMIVIGDHQPPALVTGEGASWDVPVHVVSSRTEILDRLTAQGFRKGLDPGAGALAKMHELLPVLLDAFGDREAATLQASSAARE
jgi:Sulfatase